MNRRRRTDEPVKNIHKETEYHTVVTDDGTQDEGFNCKACGKFITVRDCGTNNRNHCPHCLSSIHLDNIPGDRSADCGGIMEPISIYVRPDGEWALIHRCKKCGELKINRIAADDNEYHTVVTDDGTQDEGFNCKACGKFITVRDCGTNNRNHCPHCLSSIHLDNIPGDRSADCGGIMEPISIYVRPDGEWALIHRCKKCGELKINRIAADDNEYLLLSLACKPLANPPFPLSALSFHFGKEDK